LMLVSVHMFRFFYFFFFSSRRRHTRSKRDWSSDVCSSDLEKIWDFQPGDDPLDREIAAQMRGKRLPAIGNVEISIMEETQSRWRSEERRVGKEGRARGAPEH